MSQLTDAAPGYPLGELVDVRLDVEADVALLRVDGELDFFTATVLADRLARAVASDVSCATVELDGATFVSLAAFRVLADAAKLLEARGATMVVRNPPRSLRILSEVVGGAGFVLEETGAHTGV